MIQDLSFLFEFRRPTLAMQKRAPILSTIAFDGLYAFLSFVLAIGIFIDVWSHSSFGPDQSVLSPYHFLFYSSMATIGGLLIWTHSQNVRQGYAWASALPVGYGFSFFGLMMFAISGGIDLLGHAVFGFETGIEAVMSPTHVFLFIGWFIIAIAPIRAAFARQKTRPAANLFQQLPVIIAAMSALCAVTVATIYYTPLSSYSYAVQEMRNLDEDFSMSMEIASIFIQTGVLMSLLLWMMRHIPFKTGALWLLFILYGVLLSITNSEPIAIANTTLAGLGVEILYRVLQPTPERRWRFQLFGFLAPMTIWILFYGFYLVTNIGGGLWFTGYVWLGTVFQSGFVGLVLALFATSNEGSLQ